MHFLKNVTTVLTLVLISAIGHARVSDGQVKTEIGAKSFTATLKPGFHFNKEAPAKLISGGTELQPSVKNEKTIEFDTGKIKDAFTVSFYVCDDANTACEEHSYLYQMQNGKWTTATEPTNKTLDPGSLPEKKTTVVINEHGFITNDINAALAKARAEKKKIFVEVGAPWCPPCMRLDTEVFGTAVFKQATKGFVKLQLNDDLETNRAFHKKYDIKALPTMMILDADGTELYRIVDSKPAPELSRDIKAQLNTKKDAVASLEKQAASGDKKAMLKLAKRSYDAFDMESALKWLSQIGDKTALYADVEIAVWSEKDLEDEKVKQEFIEILKKWIAHDPKSYTAITARNSWGDLYKDKVLPAELTQQLKLNIAELAWMVDNPKAIRTLFKKWAVKPIAPYEKEEILAQQIQSTKTLKEDVSELQAKLTAEMGKHKFSIERPGQIFEAVSYFRAAGMVKQEEEWLMKFVEAQPQNYVFPMRLAYFYKRQKNFPEALKWAEKAVALGEDTRYHNLENLAQIQKELKQTDAAKQTVARALAMPEAKNDRFKTTTKSFEELKKSL